MTMLKSLAHRIYGSVIHRPWLLDIVAGAGAIAWGFWVGHAGAAALATMTKDGGWAHLKPVMHGLINSTEILGALQLGVALLKLHRARQVVAIAKAILWGYVAYGLTVASGQAAYGILAMHDFLIFARCY